MNDTGAQKLLDKYLEKVDVVYLYTMYNDSKIKSDRQILIDIITGRLISYNNEELQLNINKCTNGVIITLSVHDYIDSIKFTNTEFNMFFL